MAENTVDPSTVEDAIGYHFADPVLLTTALTHSSYAAEHDVESYERLEFLGDAVLELAVTGRIFELLGDSPEGRMTRVRAVVVDESTLAEVACDIGLRDSIRLGIGEDRSGGRDRSSILSDVFESILGAVYLDGGVDAAFAVVYKLLGGTMDERVASLGVSDARSAFQELLAQSGRSVVFEYERTGPDHDATYTATAYVDGRAIAVGGGTSKKTAAIDASRKALESDF